MSSNEQDEASLRRGDGLLEDRLRDLILSNNQPAPPTSPRPVDAIVPPFLATTSRLEPEESRKQASPVASSGVVPPSQSPHGGRKRLNQAQRRQMSTQMSIPIDPRPMTQGIQRGRGFSPSTEFAVQPRPYTTSIGQQDQTQYQPQQYSPSHRGHASMSFRSDLPQSQRQHANTRIHEAQVVPQQGHAQQFSNLYPRALQPSNFHGHRAQEHHYVLAPDQKAVRPAPQHDRLYQPGPYAGREYGVAVGVDLEQAMAQCDYLDALLSEYVPKIGIGAEEIQEKEIFRATVEQVCREAILDHEIIDNKNPTFNAASVELKCFGSMASGFATKGSDMDLALLIPHSRPPPDSPESSIPRLLEKRLLDMGFGARLLTKTRVPIIKLCQKPTEKLMHDLQEERKKWEDGFTIKETVGDEQAPKKTDISDGISEQGGNDAIGAKTTKLPTVTYDEQLASLHQKPEESLMDYYGSANRLLRKLGSRDIDKSCGIPPEQTAVESDVCKAFINGLCNADLRASLSKYQSITFSDTAKPAQVRLLRCVFAQIQGEQLAMAWDNRQVRERTEMLESEGQNAVDCWRKLLDRTYMAPMKYIEMLHQAISRLKKMSSLQLVLLEQGSQESPQQYYSRAASILDRLRSPHDVSVLAVAIAHYTNGIRNPQIREALQTMTSSNKLVSLSVLAIQHRMIHLASEYETALSKNLYAEQDRVDIERYVNFLRSCNVDYATQIIETSGVHTVMNEAAAALITKIRSLPDPSHALHKPRDRYKDHLEFPKRDIGIQCDINFSAQLGLHNTLLLRCYSLTDNRVKPLILFVKYWARVRGINTPYRGSLSSYGYVLMVLHYLVNVATPFVCPNLQELYRSPPSYLPPDEVMNKTTCKGYDVRFWRNEREIANLAESKMLNHNQDSIGKLLRGFFEYYAQSGALSIGGRGFDWGHDVISLRTHGGLATKQQKGWVGARTVTETRTEAAPIPAPSLQSLSTQVPSNSQQTVGHGTSRKTVTREEVKEIRHRYLFAIEDPFEIDHNVARTVTHDGIVAIRDEFRRAWRIISSVGKKEVREGLLEEAVAQTQSKSEFGDLMDLLHGKLEDVKMTA